MCVRWCVSACVLDDMIDIGGGLLNPGQLSGLLYSVVPEHYKEQPMHADVILKRKFPPLQARSYSYFIPLKRTFSCHWKPVAECQPLHIFTIQQQFLWTSSSRCCQFSTFLSFSCLCLHGSLRVCSACRREGQSGRRRARRGSASQLHNMGDLQSPCPVILTRCCDPLPL